MRTKIKQYPAHKKSKVESRNSKFRRRRCGSVLVLVAVTIVILSVLGLGMLSVAYGVRHKAAQLKNEAAAMLAAEAGYERAIFWMGKQLDIQSALGSSGVSDGGSLPGGSFDYQIKGFVFVGSRPVYRVISNGHSGVFNRTVDAYVIQAISGWDMGQCRVPTGGTSTAPVSFTSGEIIDIPIHINKLDDSPDERDIYITMGGNPRFLREVAMGELKGSKYPSSIMALFEGGICFDQPDSKITDESAVQMKVDRFRTFTDSDYNFSDDTGKKPVANAPVGPPERRHSAVQIEFFVEGGIGKVQITNNCTVLGYQRNKNGKTYDFKIIPGTNGTQSERYDIYAYHYTADSEPQTKVNITDTYVTQSFGGIESEPAGQIFVDGDVVIGGSSSISPDMMVQGKITVVATGNIWLADCIRVSNDDDSGTYYPRDSNGMPDKDTPNPNILGLIAQGVVKVIDPGISEQTGTGSPNYYPGLPSEPNGWDYKPIGRWDGGAEYKRHLPDPVEVEATMVIGGGGWGAENVQRSYWGTTYGGRKEWPGSDQDTAGDYLYVRGSIVERCRGVVGLIGYDGFYKRYYFDERVLLGILPGDIWLQGKYVPAPAGWHDYRH